MNYEFKIIANNFGPIDHANINFKKLNIIGGINSTGKTFLSKLLYCLSMSFSEEGMKIANNEIKYLFVDFKDYWIKNIKKESINSIDYDSNNIENKLNLLIEEWDENKINYKYFKRFYDKFKSILNEYNLLDNDRCVDDLENIKNKIKQYQNNYAYVLRVISLILTAEFERNQLPIFENSDVIFKGENMQNNFEYNLKFKKNGMEIKSNNIDNTQINFKNVFYLNSLTILDGINLLPINGSSRRYPYHMLALQGALLEPKFNIFEGIYDEKINRIYEKITKILGGYFEFDSNHNIIFKSINDNDIEQKFNYGINNMASGYKQLGALQMLLNNKQLSKDSVVIFDEPEVNLHPKLQVDLANILVQISKELDVIIYINSHSPIFIEAMSLYAEKYGLIEDTNFYLTEKSNSETKYNFIEIKYSDIVEIYNNLCKPFDDLNDLRNELNNS